VSEVQEKIMKPFHQYWTFSAIRGAMTVFAALAILAVPQGQAFIFNAPLTIGLAINCLATFSIFDGGVMILLANLLPERAINRKVLYGQALMAISSGLLLYAVISGVVGLYWLMWIAAFQAALAAFAEGMVARDTHYQYGCLSCYTTSMVLGFSALALPLAGWLNATGMSIALASYVGLYGTSELILGGRMLFLEYRSEHPATALSEAWRVEMLNPAAAPHLSTAERKACVTCADCPANALCHDDSLSGQMARIMAQRSSSIVRAMRAEALLQAPAVWAEGD
jgi:hypothetical protein